MTTAIQTFVLITGDFAIILCLLSAIFLLPAFRKERIALTISIRIQHPHENLNSFEKIRP